jgi:hypothetical protein
MQRYAAFELFLQYLLGVQSLALRSGFSRKPQEVLI